MNNKSRQNKISALIIVIGTIISFIALGPKNSKSQQEVERQEQISAMVSVIEIGREENKGKLEKTAVISAGNNSAEIIAQYSGRITRVDFEVGASVNEGDVIATFDQSDLENPPKVALDSAKNSFALALDNLKKTEEAGRDSISLAKNAIKIAELQYEQAKDAAKESANYDAKDLAEESFENAEDQKKQLEKTIELQENAAKLQLEQARSALELAEIAYQQTFIKAPVSGKVVTKKVSNGDQVNIGQNLGQIIGPGKVEAVVFFTKEEVERISQGNAAVIKSGAEMRSGSIKSISLIANQDNQRYEVKIESDGELSSWANRSVTINLDLNISQEGTPSFFVPLEALKIGQQKSQVFLFQEEKAVAREVETGIIIGTQIEIVSGLSEGDLLIVENARNLRDGQEVKFE